MLLTVLLVSSCVLAVQSYMTSLRLVKHRVTVLLGVCDDSSKICAVGIRVLVMVLYFYVLNKSNLNSA